ncbi:hypothetical protein EDC94DRAFT_648694 [Helicostylum pulchrum]|nr:hypothetical protein EDC94DRAFT_648694 [Helicostylum pulchrum]
MSDLPAEVCRTIFNNLEKKDIFECLFVCKSWCTYASQIYWKEVSIYSKRITDVKKFLESTDRHQYFKYGSLTRTLLFEPMPDTGNKYRDENQPEEYDSDHEEEEPGQEESLLENFNMHQITQLTRYFQIYKILKYLHLLLYSELKHLKKISIIKNPSFFDTDYDSICFTFCSIHRDTLTSLKFFYTDGIPLLIKNRPIDLYRLLSPFKNLTELIFLNSFDGNLSFTQIQKICPNLTIFSYENEFRMTKPIFQKQIDITDNSAIEMNRNLKKLYLVIDNLPVCYSNYFLKHLPNQLEHFYLNMSSFNLFQWVEKVGDFYSAQFMERLNRLRTFDIYFADKIMEYECELYLPDKRISIIGFEIVNRFLLYCVKDDIFANLPRKDVEDVPRIILECALLKCPNLDHFEVEIDLHFHKINVGPRLAVNVSKSHSNGHEYLKVVKLQNIFDHSKVLESLITHLPNIEVLSFHYFLHHSYDRFHQFKNYGINLTGFASLQYFYFYAGVRRNIDVAFVIYSFLYSDGDEKNYLHDTQEGTIKPFKDFDNETDDVEVIIIQIDKSVQVILHNSLLDFVIGIFENGHFLNLDYPVVMEPYEDNDY